MSTLHWYHYITGVYFEHVTLVSLYKVRQFEHVTLVSQYNVRQFEHVTLVSLYNGRQFEHVTLVYQSDDFIGLTSFLVQGCETDHNISRINIPEPYQGELKTSTISTTEITIHTQS